MNFSSVIFCQDTFENKSKRTFSQLYANAQLFPLYRLSWNRWCYFYFTRFGDVGVGRWFRFWRGINSVLCWILSFLIKEKNVWSYGQSSKAGKFSFKQEKWVTFTIFMTSSSPDSEVRIWEDAPDSGRRITSILCCVVLFLIKEDDLWSYAWTKFENWKIDSISIYN